MKQSKRIEDGSRYCNEIWIFFVLIDPFDVLVDCIDDEDDCLVDWPSVELFKESEIGIPFE